MSFTPADPIISGKPYPVLEVEDRAPVSLDDFLGEREFKVRQGEETRVICGIGTEHGDWVHFTEKDVQGSAKDVRVWKVVRGPSSGFVAEHAAHF